MIFGDLEKLVGTTEKNFYKEKIDIYIDLVESFCMKNDIALSGDSNDAWVREAVRMGALIREQQATVLQNFLGDNMFKRYKRAVSTFLDNKTVFGNLCINLNDEERAKLQIAEMDKANKITLVDLFCGAGGLSLGFIQEGYSVVFANDIEPMCVETYRYNHPNIPDNRVVCGDLRQMVHDIRREIPESVDIVIGGPPCQGFSSANKHHRVIDDPRNELYKYYLKAVTKLAPKVVVMENVRGMLKVANQVVEDYKAVTVKVGDKNLHYKIAYKLLNSADFSVAQSRERLIYIAIRDDICEMHNITPEDVFNTIKIQNKSSKRFNLEDALEYIRPLTAPHKKGVGEKDTEEHGRKIEINRYSGKENDYLRLINCGRKIPYLFNHKARYCSDLNQEIYSRMKQGDDGTAPQIQDIFPYKSRNDKFKDKYFRLYADRPCRTITAHLRSDCHSHIHPFQDRTLTPREAARVQSFPDDYLFMGPYLKTYIQIGNAVPVVMARGIAKALLPLFGGIE